MKASRGGRSQQSSAGSARAAALKILLAVMRDGRSLEAARDTLFERGDEAERPQAMAIANGVLRWRFRLEALLGQLLEKPLRGKDEDIRILLLMALYEIEYMSSPDYAVVNEAAGLCRRRRKAWAAGLLNGVLRNFLRRRESLNAEPQGDGERYSHPQWLLDRLRADWPDQWQAIAQANNARAPMWLRVNILKLDVGQYMEVLREAGIDARRHPFAPQALRLGAAVNVKQLPGFDDGAVSVQDAGAQLCAALLEVQPDDVVLDLCAAPGGKACHLLELQPRQRITAVDIEEDRMRRVEQNLARLGLQAQCRLADATDPGWCADAACDRILVDAPCSATGVIRRHPDIKTLRRADDIEALCALQDAIVDNAWRMLKPGGVLLYVTCSVLRAENEARIARLLAAHHDAAEDRIDAPWGVACAHGRQLLPGEDDCDGFYYARIIKR